MFMSLALIQAYSGEWHDGRYAGEGTLTLPSGAKYEGQIRSITILRRIFRFVASTLFLSFEKFIA